MDIIGLPGFVGAYSTPVAPAAFTLADDVIMFAADNTTIVFDTDGGDIVFASDNETIVMR